MSEEPLSTVDELRALIGHPLPRTRDKVTDHLDEIHREWLAHTPFVVLATAGTDGRTDASPKGDPPGRLVHVIDDRTVALAERPGNKRVDGYLNVLDNPHAGLVCIIPGRGDTLRINGRARLVREAPWFDEMVVKRNRPLLALVIDVEEVFFHCAKAFMRSRMWHPEDWDPTAVSTRAEIAQLLERPDETIDALEEYYGAQYSAGLY